MSSDGRLGEALRGVAVLSVGSVLVQSISAVSQVLLAVWLTPVDFGHWAAAVSSLALLTGLVNFGEVNGLLASHNASLGAAFRRTRRINSLLATIGVAVSGVYLLNGQEIVAALVLINSLHLPLLGESNLLYAACIRSRVRLRVVVAQLGASVTRIACGVTVAWITNSAFALFAAMLGYTLVVVIGQRLALPKSAYRGDERERPPFWKRTQWAGQSVTAMAASQVDFFIISLISTSALLGTYYLSYQITVGISALLVGPLAKSALSEMASASVARRNELAVGITRFMLPTVAVLGLLIVLVLEVGQQWLPVRWHDVVPVVAILLASLPARFLTPIADAVYMSSDLWKRSIRFNVVDIVGTGLAAVTVITQELLVVATAIAVWKIGFASIRWCRAVSTVSKFGQGIVALSVMLYGTGFVVSGFASGTARYSWMLAVVAIIGIGAVALGSKRTFVHGRI